MSKLHIENCDVDQDEAIRKLKERGFTITPPDEKIVVECGGWCVSASSGGLGPYVSRGGRDYGHIGCDASVLRNGHYTFGLTHLRDLNSAMTEWLDRYDMRENGGDVCALPTDHGQGSDRVNVFGTTLFRLPAWTYNMDEIDGICRTLRQIRIKHKDGGGE